MQIKKDIILRFGILYLGIVVLAIWIVGKIFFLQVVEGEKWKAQEQKQNNKDITIDANRGDILAADGRKLACSVPSYRIYMDMLAQGLTDEIFNANVDSLAICLSRFFGDNSVSYYRNKLKSGYQQQKRYFMIHPRRISYTDLREVKKFPLFRLGGNKGGFIARKYERRKLPFGLLAQRTIGSLYAEKELGGRFGLEMAYNQDLRGINGISTKTRVSGNWVTEEQVAPIDGKDIITTIDIGLQDVAESALLEQLRTHNAEHGTAVLMEVSTGAIKAIANLGRTPSGKYIEKYNYAVGEASEPGSTFKLASMIVALEDGYINLEDSIETGRGTCKFYDRTMKDSHHGGYGTLSVKEVFEKSSNVGVSKIIFKHYKDNPRRFVDRLYAMGLNEPLGLEIKGEGHPMIKYPGDKNWYGTTLPWMSIGYAVKQTPLQILSFYNAIANNGKMVKPMFVKAISHHGDIEQTFEPVVLNPSICSLETIEKVHEMMVGVVERGTARNIRNERYQIAGKTGTAQVAKGAGGYGNKGGKVEYQASFVGYFPADRPLYSCIVVIKAPSGNTYYANVVAGNVFKEISDRVYANSFNNPEVEDNMVIEVSEHLPYSKGGKKEELLSVFDEIGINVKGLEVESEWISTQAQEYAIHMKSKNFPEGLVPNVRGMGAKDAVSLLENMGLKVVIRGVGKVVEQSLSAGQTYRKGATIYLRMH